MRDKIIWMFEGLPDSGKTTAGRKVFERYQDKCIYRKNKRGKEVKRAILDMASDKLAINTPGDVEDELERDLSRLMGINTPGDVKDPLEDDLSYLIGKGCNYIVCAARACKKWESSRIKVVDRLANQHGYDVRRIKMEKVKANGNPEAEKAEIDRIINGATDKVITEINAVFAAKS